MKEKNWFKYLVLTVVLLIPFMYSFFYLKAYWNPYGEGNIDNLPVAIVNLDEGENGNTIVKSIQDSKKLKISVVSEEEANVGLYNGEYYAVINIPKNFTSDLESVQNEVKIHPTITYSPNQKSNYLASQIINNVVSVVEKNLDNQVNSKIIETLENTVTSIPSELNTISDGFEELGSGTKKLEDGSKTLENGTISLQLGATSLKDGSNTLNTNYTAFHEGVKELKDGANTLNAELSKLDTINTSISTLASGITTLKSGSDAYNSGLNTYVSGVNSTLDYTNTLATFIKSTICPKVNAGVSTEEETEMCKLALGLTTANENTGNTSMINYLKSSGNTITTKYKELSTGINTLANGVSTMPTIASKLQELKTGVAKLSNGANTLYESSGKIKDGIHSLNTGITNLYTGVGSLNTGASALYKGITTLNTSVTNAKNELNSNISTTKKEVKKVESLSEYSKNPVNVESTPVNEVTSYGTAFSPLFISIALWVGCLMFYIVLYYDKEERFKKFSIHNQNHLERSCCFHLFGTVSAIVLGILLQLFLDFDITNIALYYVFLVLIVNTFMAIMNFLVTRLGDIGKFVGLIILVLQLAAAGGTFPIETVTSGFRWLHPLLPMTYTNKLLKEALISIETDLLVKNLLVVIGILIVFVGINLVVDIKDRKSKNTV